MTRAEVKRWSRLYNWGERRNRELMKFLENFGVIYPEEKTCELWAMVFTEAQQNGRPMSFSDSWIAAAALQFGVPVVTHNRKHFENVKGLKIIFAQ
jgi:predicted nucleic acid-binding protein